MKNNYIIGTLLSLMSATILLWFFEVFTLYQFIAFYVIFAVGFILGLNNNIFRKIMIVVNMLGMGLWSVTYSIGLVFALIASYTLAIKITLSFYLLPLISIFFLIKDWRIIKIELEQEGISI